jgi:hypothetical protein
MWVFLHQFQGDQFLQVPHAELQELGQKAHHLLQK